MVAHAIAEPGVLVDLLRGREDFRYPGSGSIPDVVPGASLVHFHNMHGRYLDLRALPSIRRRLPVVLTLHDEWAYTGHVAATIDCDRWLTGCGSCPHLDVTPRLLRDGTARNWQLKRDVWRELARSGGVDVVAPSRWLLERVGRSILAPAVTRTTVVPNGVDLDRFTPGDRRARREQLALPTEGRVLVFSAFKGSANPLKDFATLRAALAVLGARPGSEVVAVAIGALGERERLGRVEIRSVGSLPAESVASYLQAADLYVHPARADNHPLAVLEALGTGLPVVATRVGGIPEQVLPLGSSAHPTGALVEVGDVAALAEAVDLLLGDDDRRRAMGIAARADAVRRFDVNSQIDAYCGIYDFIAASA
jgi:glycosyltransferase involved in cell wall biosynthesis